MMIVLMRHAPTLANESGRMAVGVPGPSLSRAGEISAGRAAQEWQYREQPRVVFTSPAARAVQTAGLVFPTREPKRCAGLAEVAPGEWGTSTSQDGIQLHANLMRRWEAGADLDVAPPDGESGAAVIDRLASLVAELRKVEQGPIVAVTHFGVIRMLLAGFVFGYDHRRMPSAEFPSPLQALALRWDQFTF